MGDSLAFSFGSFGTLDDERKEVVVRQLWGVEERWEERVLTSFCRKSIVIP